MIVIPTNISVPGVPDYYECYLGWMAAYNAGNQKHNDLLVEAFRCARLAEEFGQALIKDDITLDDEF